MIAYYHTSRERTRRMLTDGLKVRLRNARTGAFLHLSGESNTRSPKYAWVGSLAQAKTLKSRAAARGEPWPYQAVARAVTDFAPEQVEKQRLS